MVPNLGVCDLLDVGSGEEGKAALGSGGHGLVLADIPGLLEGAHEGLGGEMVSAQNICTSRSARLCFCNPIPLSLSLLIIPFIHLHILARINVSSINFSSLRLPSSSRTIVLTITI